MCTKLSAATDTKARLRPDGKNGITNPNGGMLPMRDYANTRKCMSGNGRRSPDAGDSRSPHVASLLARLSITLPVSPFTKSLALLYKYL